MRDPYRTILFPLRALAVLAALTLPLLALPLLAQDGPAMRRALSLAGQGDWGGAASAAPGAVGRDIIEWQKLRAGEGTLGEYETFLARRADWPGLALLRAEGEAAVARSTSPERVIAYFDGRAPTTGPGAVALVKALLQQGLTEGAEAAAVRAWTELSFGPEAQAELLALVPEALAPVHWTRLDRLLWEDEAAEARRMLPLVGPDRRLLAEARLVLRAQGAGVDARVAAVPAALADDPGLAWERFLWRARKDRQADALELILARSTSAESLGRPDIWAPRRASLARALMRDGEARTAYRLAASHFLTGGADYADLEFLAGFLALRKLDDPQAALGHFRRLRAAVVTPISLSRAAYWEGRAEEALGRDEEARAAFAYAAEFQTAFYGQLAAERLGLPLDEALVRGSDHPDWRQSAFASSSVLEAAMLLQAAGNRAQAKRFFLHLAEGLDATGLGQLGDLVLELDEPHIAVLIGKQAADRGIILPRAYFPVTDLVPDGLEVSRALGLSIARRESEFDPVVVSPAGARGLMQVMPETARMMANRTGRPYDRARLTSDPAYNAVLGTAYLKQLIEEFGPSIALVAAGYNAGPGRPRAWVDAFGDPRREAVDVVDWIETIPFTETRTYIMRVAESVVIYRARLKGETGPVRITAELRG
jgi:soluble lytic murein transglycosylase